MVARKYSNIAVETTLSIGIGAGDTTLTVDSASGWPAAPFTLIIDEGEAAEELIHVGTKVSTTFSILTRGFGGTNASAHTANASIKHVGVAEDFSFLWSHAHDGVDDSALISHADLLSTHSVKGFRMDEPIYFTADDTFVKANFPELRAVIVEVQGAGGAGGGADATGTGESSFGAGGAGGGYSRSLILASSLAASETITVGSGGNGAAGAGGGNGANSSFGTHVVANGGNGGGSVIPTGTSGATRTGTSRPGAGTGDLTLPGNPGAGSLRITAQQGLSGEGGHGLYGKGGGQSKGSGGAGEGGGLHGAGGGGAANVQDQAATAGGNGLGGIVIVTPLY